MKPFWRGFCLGFAGPIYLLSLHRYRKGQRYKLNMLPIEIREDWTRWNSIRFRWLIWWNGIEMHRLSADRAGG